MRTFGCLMLAALVFAPCGCGSDDDDKPGEEACVAKSPITIADPSEAPPDEVGGARLGCLGGCLPEAGAAVELTGYVRTLADPDANNPVPAAKIEVFTNEGTKLIEGQADISKKGRVSLNVATRETGFTGYAIVTSDGFIPWRFKTSRAVTTSAVDGWAWLTTQEEADTVADGLAVEFDAGRGLLVGAVHDCDAFGVENAVVLVGGKSDGVLYVEGFEVVADRAFTTETGRFVLPQVSPGSVDIEAYARLETRGPLTLISSVTIEVEAGKMNVVSLDPLVGTK